jgi:hypothetical protein
MKGQVLSIYLHRFLLRSLSLLELLELRRVHSPVHSILHHKSLSLGVRLSLHSLSLTTSVRCELLSVNGASFQARAFRWGWGVVRRCWGLGPIAVHVHVGLVTLHLLHDLHLLVLLELLGQLLLGAVVD